MPALNHQRLASGRVSMVVASLSACLAAWPADVAADSALQPRGSPAAPAQRFQAGAPLPDTLHLGVIDGAELAALRSDVRPWGCGGWVFQPKADGSQEPGSPVMALVAKDAQYAGSPGGVAKLADSLWPVEAYPGNVTASEMPFHGIGFMVGPFIPLASLADQRQVASNPDQWRDPVFMRILSNDVRTIHQRTACAMGNGLCRRYAGRFEAHWFAFPSGRIKTVDLHTATLIIEDRCPLTRSAMVEFYANKLGLMQWFHRWTNP